jgi:hypothetical protein
MKYIIGFSLLILVFGCSEKENYSSNSTSVAQNELRIGPADTMAIKNIVEIQAKSKNFEELEKIWADDGRWLQAFGRVFYGKDSIINFIKVLHNNPGYAVSTASNYGDPEIKFLRPDIAVVHQYHEREGQIINGVVTPTRRINTTYIMSKENGTWLLRDKVTMDERERSNN